MKLDKNVLNMCEKAIQYRLGNLEDMPYELANTVANIYYKFVETAWDKEWNVTAKEIDDDSLFQKIDEIEDEFHVNEILTDKHPDPGGILIGGIDALEKARRDSLNAQDLGLDGLGPIGELVGRQVGMFQTQATLEFVFVNISLHWLRLLAKHPEHFKYHSMMVETMLDTFKYRIEKVLDKSPLRRKVERKFRKSHVDEIPNLIDLVDVM